MPSEWYLPAMIAVFSLVTIFLRFFPFLLFRRKTPETLLALGRLLPGAIMAMLIVYCLKDTQVAVSPYGLPATAALLLVVLLYRLRRGTLLPIVGGTVCYMGLLQLFPLAA